MKRAKLFLIGLFAAFLPMLMAPTGGFPSRPTFTHLSINNSSGTQDFGQVNLNTTTSGVASYMTFNNLGTQKGIIVNERTAGANCAGSSVDDFCLRSVSGRLYGVDSAQSGRVVIESDTTITWSFQTGTSNCTVNGTNATVQLHRLGNVVTGVATSAGSCTIASGNGQVTTNTPVPVGYRPATQPSGCGPSFVTTPTSTIGTVCVSSTGNLGATFVGTATTNMGVASVSFTYTID